MENALRAALNAPDIADQLATALRAMERGWNACVNSTCASLDGFIFPTDAIAMTRSVLRRYDDSRKEHA